MSTLGELKARIWDDLFSQDDLNPSTTPQIGQAIADAIRFYQRKRFFFNEARGVDLPTVAGQAWYDLGSAGLPVFEYLDGVFVVQPGYLREIRQDDVAMFEYLTASGGSQGEPYEYALYGQRIGLYPTPDKAYTVRVMGHVRLSAPTVDTDGTSPWTNDAFELIRCKAKALLYAHTKNDLQMASACSDMERQELASLMGETFGRVAYDGFRKTDF